MACSRMATRSDGADFSAYSAQRSAAAICDVGSVAPTSALASTERSGSPDRIRNGRPAAQSVRAKHRARPNSRMSSGLASVRNAASCNPANRSSAFFFSTIVFRRAAAVATVFVSRARLARLVRAVTKSPATANSPFPMASLIRALMRAAVDGHDAGFTGPVMPGSLSASTAVLSTSKDFFRLSAIVIRSVASSPRLAMLNATVSRAYRSAGTSVESFLEKISRESSVRSAGVRAFLALSS